MHPGDGLQVAANLAPARNNSACNFIDEAGRCELSSKWCKEIDHLDRFGRKCLSLRPLVPMILDQHYINLKSQVIKAERRVLKELGFCVHVKHPHKLIVMYLKYLELEKHQNMMQMAWNFMNDSFRTDVFVRYQPETIACACIYLTARKQNIPLPANPGWFLIFRVSEEDMLDVCYRIMSLYKRSKPNAEALDSAVDALKKRYQDQKKKDRSDTSTPPTVVMVDRNNGSHNAWGGFISRALPVSTGSGGDNDSGNNGNNNDKDGKKTSQSKSRSRTPRSHSRSRTPRSRSASRSSRSKSGSRSPASRSRSRSSDAENAGTRKGIKKSRHRSRTPISKSSGAKKKSKQYSRSRSGSPESPKYKKSSSDKKYDRRRDESRGDARYINGSDRDKRGSRDHRERSSHHSKSSGYDRDDYRKSYRSSHGNGDKRDKYGGGGGRSHRHHGSSSHRSSKHGDRDRDRRR